VIATGTFFCGLRFIAWGSRHGQQRVEGRDDIEHELRMNVVCSAI